MGVVKAVYKDEVHKLQLYGRFLQDHIFMPLDWSYLMYVEEDALQLAKKTGHEIIEVTTEPNLQFSLENEVHWNNSKKMPNE